MNLKEKVKRKDLLMQECLKIFMVGTLEDLEKNIHRLCERYFPKCNKIFKNHVYFFYSDLRTAVYSLSEIDYSLAYHIE